MSDVSFLTDLPRFVFFTGKGGVDARQAFESVSTVPDYLPIPTARYAREQLRAAAQAEGRIAKAVPEILFICVHNAGRSQIATALAEHPRVVPTLRTSALTTRSPA